MSLWGTERALGVHDEANFAALQSVDPRDTKRTLGVTLEISKLKSCKDSAAQCSLTGLIVFIFER
jgi:hypothetical protein